MFQFSLICILSYYIKLRLLHLIWLHLKSNTGVKQIWSNLKGILYHESDTHSINIAIFVWKISQFLDQSPGKLKQINYISIWYSIMMIQFYKNQKKHAHNIFSSFSFLSSISYTCIDYWCLISADIVRWCQTCSM